jgi:hypothetical protein
MGRITMPTLLIAGGPTADEFLAVVEVFLAA